MVHTVRGHTHTHTHTHPHTHTLTHAHTHTQHTHTDTHAYAAFECRWHDAGKAPGSGGGMGGGMATPGTLHLEDRLGALNIGASVRLKGYRPPLGDCVGRYRPVTHSHTHKRTP